MSGAHMDPEQLARVVHHIADCILYYERLSSLPDCNTCGKQRSCKYRPAWGDPVRINCPLYQEMELKGADAPADRGANQQLLQEAT